MICKISPAVKGCGYQCLANHCAMDRCRFIGVPVLYLGRGWPLIP